MIRSLLPSIARAISALAIATCGATALAAFPEGRPIELVVPWPAGQEADIVGRALSNSLSKRLGTTVQVINKPGAGGVPGTAELVRAKPDGHSIGFLSIGPVVSQPLAGNAPYKSSDLEPIGLISASAFVLAVKADGPIKTIADLEARAKVKPVIVGTFGPAAVPTQVVHRMAKAKGWQVKPVTFPAAGWAQLAAGDAEVVTAPYNTIAGQLKSGQARALVVFGKERIAALPETPTLREAGYGFDALVWVGFFAPKGTPAPVLEQVGKAVRESLKDPEIVELAARINVPLFFMDPKDTAEQLRDDEAALRPLMDTLGLAKK